MNRWSVKVPTCKLFQIHCEREKFSGPSKCRQSILTLFFRVKRVLPTKFCLSVWVGCFDDMIGLSMIHTSKLIYEMFVALTEFTDCPRFSIDNQLFIWYFDNIADSCIRQSQLFGQSSYQHVRHSNKINDCISRLLKRNWNNQMVIVTIGTTVQFQFLRFCMKCEFEVPSKLIQNQI